MKRRLLFPINCFYGYILNKYSVLYRGGNNSEIKHAFIYGRNIKDAANRFEFLFDHCVIEKIEEVKM